MREMARCKHGKWWYIGYETECNKCLANQRASLVKPKPTGINALRMGGENK